MAASISTIRITTGTVTVSHSLGEKSSVPAPMAAAGKAALVTAMDISGSALDMARKNAERNGLDIVFRQGDVFEVLPQLKAEHALFDFIILIRPPLRRAGRLSGMQEAATGRSTVWQ